MSWTRFVQPTSSCENQLDCRQQRTAIGRAAPSAAGTTRLAGTRPQNGSGFATCAPISCRLLRDPACSMTKPAEDATPVGRFVHLDVLTAHAPWSSPSTPEHYVQALARQYPIGPSTTSKPRPALAVADYVLHSAVKTAVACERPDIDHIGDARARGSGAGEAHLLLISPARMPPATSPAPTPGTRWIAWLVPRLAGASSTWALGRAARHFTYRRRVATWWRSTSHQPR